MVGGPAWLVATLGLASFVLCVLLTWIDPQAAYFLLPTRAWELLAGGGLCLWAADPAGAAWCERLPAWTPTCGLAVIALALLVVPEGPRFPGFWALLPVVGAACVLLPLGRQRGLRRAVAGRRAVGPGGPHVLFAVSVALAGILAGRLPPVSGPRNPFVWH